MNQVMDRRWRSLSLALAALTFASAVALIVWNIVPGFFPLQANAHDLLGALPLSLVAVAYTVHVAVRGASPYDLMRALILAAAFLFWAANQYWPDAPLARLWNDIAVVLFVVDVLLTMIRSEPGDVPVVVGDLGPK